MSNKTEVRHDTGYGLISRSITRSKNLSLQAKGIYAYLASFAGNTGKAFPTTDLMAEELGLSKNTLFKYLKELRETGAITVKREKGENEQFGRNIYYLHNRLDSNKSSNEPCIKFPYMEKPYMEKPYTRNYDTNSNNYNSNNLNSNNSTKGHSQVKEKLDNIPYKEIMDYLNEKAERQFRNVESNKKHIRARFNEGYSVEDFKQVIDNKVAEWKGDKKMEKYLRPSTLFGTKFDEYLNDIPAKEEKKVDERAKNFGYVF